MRKILYSFLGLTLLHSCAYLPPQLELPVKIEVIEELEPYLESAVADLQPPAISIGVVQGGVTRYANSFGTIDANATKRATKETVYQWWSLTKLFTAVAVLQLQEKGLININDPVNSHVRYFQVRNLQDSDQPITIRQLLSHSSGLGDVGISILGWIHFEGDPSFSQTEFLQQKLPEYNKLVVQPGEEGRYSNFGFLVLAGLIEEVSNISYEEYITTNILIPLGMEHTGFTYTEKMAPFEATGSHPRDLLSYVVPFYLDMDRAISEESNGILWFNRVYSDQKGATGLIGSTADMMKFMKALLNHGSLNGNRILTPASIAEMQKPVISVSESSAPDNEEFDFGLAWFIGQSDGERTLSHGGGGMAFVTMLKLYPERDLGVVVFSNSTYLGRFMGSNITKLIGSIDWQADHRVDNHPHTSKTAELRQ